MRSCDGLILLDLSDITSNHDALIIVCSGLVEGTKLSSLDGYTSSYVLMLLL